VWRIPWVIETLVFWLVLWQESIRLELRTAHRQLPMPPWLQDVYYYRSGDFANGYVNAFLIDGVASLVLHWAGVTEAGGDAWWRRALLNEPRRALAATALSTLVIIAVETFPSALTRADWLDIPAGVAGALCYLCIRLIGLKLQRR
jgi:hypothetical protein